MVKECLKCRPGYSISYDHLSCSKCKVQYCADCSAGIDSCINCMVGFYFNITTNKCQLCSDIDSDCQ